jgi:hypothetical protein
VYRFDYRNRLPLYVDETMSICVKRNESRITYTPRQIPLNPHHAKYDVWIEGSGGGLAVLGQALVGPLGSEGEHVYEG